MVVTATRGTRKAKHSTGRYGTHKKNCDVSNSNGMPWKTVTANRPHMVENLVLLIPMAQNRPWPIEATSKIYVQKRDDLLHSQ